MEQTVIETEKCNNENPEWIERYAQYADSLINNQSVRNQAYNSFRMPSELFCYTSISGAKKVTANSTIEIDIRYLGQSIATLKIGKKGERILSVNKDRSETNSKNFNYPDIHECPWDSRFRAHFRESKPHTDNGKRNEEHRIENLLLREFSKTKGENKLLKNIQPVKFGQCYFQMPTPLTASGKNSIKYSGHSGGGIDILTRVKRDNRTRLCVMEANKSEPAEVVTKQAIQYAVFVLKLLRSKSGDKWWKLFGMEGQLPDSIIIDAAVVMPGIEKPGFVGGQLPLGGDKIELHFVSFDDKSHEIQNIVSSL